MADVWISLLTAGTLLLVGFAASLAFHRFRVPDFIVLLLLGAGLSQIPFPPFGSGLIKSLGPLLPLFTELTIAFILFEGGLSLRLREAGRSIPAILAHSVVAMAATAFLIYLALTSLFGLSQPGALVVAIAFSGPSASVALSFAPRMRLDPRAETAIVLEGVITNVFAVIGVLVAVEWYSAPGSFLVGSYLAQVAEAVALGAAVGFGWGRIVRRLAEQRFIYIATIAVAISAFAAGEGFLGGNGAIAVFVLGIVLSRERVPKERTAPARSHRSPEDVLRELTRFIEATDAPRLADGNGGAKPAENLRNFQSEVTFALRTFFFVYLGLLLTSEWAGLGTVLASAVIVVAFLVGRLPTTAALGSGLALAPRDTRAIYASMARGMTDVVLLLFAAQSGIVPAAEVSFLQGIIPTVVIAAAIVSSVLVVWAGHSPGEREARRVVGAASPQPTAATPKPTATEASRRG